MGITNYIRRQFKNGVSVTDTVPAGFSNSATTFTAADGTTFPDGSVGPFIVCADQGLTTEEKILVQSRSGAVFTVATGGRGYNGTTAATHAAGCSILHTIDAQDMDEANQTMAQTIGAIAAKGDLLVGSAANTLTKLGIGATAQTLQVVAGTLSYVGFGSGRSQNVASSNADGTDTTYARSDHTHSGVTTFNTRNGAVSLTAADVEALFTADQQILSGTGSGTGEIIDLMTAWREYFASAGQLNVGTGAGTGELLAKGSAGTVLTVGGADASGLEWVAPLTANPAGRMHNTSAVGCTNNATVQVTSMASDFTAGGVTFGTNGLTVPVSGKYLITANTGSLNLTGNATLPASPVTVFVYKNGAQLRLANGAASSNYPAIGLTTIESLAANDVLTLYFNQSSGSTAFCDPANGNLQGAWLAVELVSQ